jgi:hypothetical protein
MNAPTSTRSMTCNITVKRANATTVPSLNPRTWYCLKDAYDRADVINSVGHMELRGNGRYSGQHWQIRSNGDSTYFLRKSFQEQKRQLEMHPHDRPTPISILQTFAPVTGKYWQMKQWGGKTWHLQNAYNRQLSVSRCCIRTVSRDIILARTDSRGREVTGDVPASPCWCVLSVC